MIYLYFLYAVDKLIHKIIPEGVAFPLWAYNVCHALMERADSQDRLDLM